MARTYEIPPALGGERLDRVVIALLSRHEGVSLSRRQAREFISGRNVRIDGTLERRSSTRPGAHQRVTITLDALELFEEDAPPRARIELTERDLLHEDEDLIAVSKPSGLLSQASRDPRRDHLIAALGRLWERRGEAPPYLALHHRLDLETSGVMVLARSRRANKGLTRAFRERLAEKTYLALTQTPPGPLPECVDNHLSGDPSSKRGRQLEVHAGGQRAITRIEVRARMARAYEVAAHPETGRRHQIRAHLASVGAPILGDPLYGGPTHVGTARVPRVMLHAWRLGLPHPVSGEYLTLESPPPDDFSALKAALR